MPSVKNLIYRRDDDPVCGQTVHQVAEQIDGVPIPLADRSRVGVCLPGRSAAAYRFGDDEDQLGEYAWYADNADDQPHPVGRKQPNRFGLHDMHGNVMEWTVDAFTEDGYATLADRAGPLSVGEALRWPSSIEGRSLRGGSWQDFAPNAVGARLGSGEKRIGRKRIPIYRLALGGLRTTRLAAWAFGFSAHQPLDDTLIAKFWEIDHQYLEEDVTSRLKEGRGIRSVVDPGLARDIEQSKR